MLKCIEGKVINVGSEYAVIDVNGLGFEINCSASALDICNNAETARIITHLQFSENGVFLFGFSDDQERELFLKLISIKGVGGKLALTVLRNLDVDMIVNAALNSQTDVFSRISGIGKKTAERICFELNRYLAGKDLETSSSKMPSKQGLTRATVIEALRSLGFSTADINHTLARIARTSGEEFSEMDEGQMIKAALKELNKG